MLFATVRQRKIYVKAPQTVVKDGVNVDVLRLEMDDEWAEMTSIICVFSNGSVKKEVMHTFGQPITVPWECLESTGVLMLGITGYVGAQKVMTTMNADNGWEIVQNSETTGEEQFEATPTLTQQLLEAATSANSAAEAANIAKQDILDAVNNGEFDGAPGKDGADGVGIASVVQTTTSIEDGGTNIVTVTKTDGSSSTFTVKNGSKGGAGGTSDHSKLSNRDAADQHPIEAITGLEAALDGKQPTGSYLTEESDPTVPAWAKEEKKPSYTAQEVGADSSGTAAGLVAAHNTAEAAHNDIRLLIQGLTDRLNALADSDDTTLDQLSEVVAYIKSNRTLIEAITTNKVSVADIVDNLTTNVSNKPLSAAQGVALKALIDAISVPDKLPNPNALTFTGAVTGSYDGSAAVTVEIPSGGGGSGDIIDVLMDVTIEEAVAAVTVTLDTPRAYKELYIATCVYGDESNSSANAMFLRVNNTATQGSTGIIAWIPQVENATSATVKAYGVAFVKLLDDCSFYYCYGSKSANARTPNSSYGERYTVFNRETIISTLKFQSINQWTKFGVGSTIKVYGVRS